MSVESNYRCSFLFLSYGYFIHLAKEHSSRCTDRLCWEMFLEAMIIDEAIQILPGVIQLGGNIPTDPY